MGDVAGEPGAWGQWLAVCGLKREAAIWGGRAVVGGGRSDLLADRLEAAIAAQRPAGLISFGVCGALRDGLAVGDLIAAKSVSDRGFRAWPCGEASERLSARLGARAVDVVGLDAVVADPGQKALLSAAFDIVDMESHIAARAAAAHGLPLAVLRVVSDDARHMLPPAAVAGMASDGGVALGAILASLARDPSQLPALLRLGRTSAAALKALARARAAL